MTSSSSKLPIATYGPQQGKLHNTNAWCAKESTAAQYLQIDFGLVKMIKSIEIQGNPKEDEFVKTFRLWYAVVPNKWITLTFLKVRKMLVSYHRNPADILL